MLTFLLQTESYSDLSQTLAAILEAAKAGEWGLVVGLVLMAGVLTLTKVPAVSKLMSTRARIWTSASAALVGAFVTPIVTDLAAGEPINWTAPITATVMAALASGGIVAVIRRQLSGKPLDRDGDGKLDRPTPDPES